MLLAQKLLVKPLPDVEILRVSSAFDSTGDTNFVISPGFFSGDTDPFDVIVAVTMEDTDSVLNPGITTLLIDNNTATFMSKISVVEGNKTWYSELWYVRNITPTTGEVNITLDHSSQFCTVYAYSVRNVRSMLIHDTLTDTASDDDLGSKLLWLDNVNGLQSKKGGLIIASALNESSTGLTVWNNLISDPDVDSGGEVSASAYGELLNTAYNDVSFEWDAACRGVAIAIALR